MESTTHPIFSRRRKGVPVSGDDLVVVQPLSDTINRGVILQSRVPNLSAVAWIGRHGAEVDTHLEKRGAVLLRGFKTANVAAFQAFVRDYSGPLLGYTNRSTPRSVLGEGVFTSTDYPAEHSIPQHNEMSYTSRWPKRLFFLCTVPPKAGGQTPLADSARVYDRLPEATRQRFEAQGVTYVRNYMAKPLGRGGNRLDLPWQQVFQTDDPKDVDAYCATNGIECHWLGGGRLRTRQRAQAAIRHPHSDAMLWFNQAHLFHISNLPEETQRELRADFAEEDLPRNAVFGDGSPIPVDDLALIRQAYRDEELLFDWQAGDLLILDNEAMTHGRRPFEAPRNIMVAMT